MLNIKHYRNKPSSNPEIVTSDTNPSLAAYEAVKADHDKKGKRLIIDGGVLKNSNIDISWLPAASETYKISADPDDYVLVDIPIVTVDVPNRNMQAFPFEEVAYFDPEFGKQIYKTFVGKMTAQDHCNDDPLKAKGVHFDSHLEYIPAYGIYKIRVLAGFDRTKDPHLVNQILSGKRNGYSMGAMCGHFLPMVAGTRVATKRGLIPIEEVKDGDIVETKGRPQRCGGAVFRGHKDVVKISTRNKIPVTASLDHTFLKLNEDLTTSWVEAGNLQEGDYIAFRIEESEVWSDDCSKASTETRLESLCKLLRNESCIKLAEIPYESDVAEVQLLMSRLGLPTAYANQDGKHVLVVDHNLPKQKVCSDPQAQNLWWLEVTKLDKLENQHPVYCIKDVEIEHNFTAEGYIVHNCSICGSSETNINPCRHMDPRLGLQKGMVWDEVTTAKAQLNRTPKFSSDPHMSLGSLGEEVLASAKKYKLIYQMCVGVNYIETSSVGDPADVSAVVDGSGIPYSISKPVWMG